MAVLTPPRREELRPADDGWDHPPRRRRRRPLRVGRALLIVVVALLAIAGLDRITGLLPNLGNPFGVERVDRTGPAVLHAITDLSQYRAASANLQVIVDVEEDAKWLPDSIRGERVLFVARGTVDAQIDLAGVRAEAVDVSSEGRSVRVRLPRATLAEPVVDPEGSYVHSRQRGLLDRIGSMFTDNPTGERELYLLARERLAAAAAADDALIRRAEANTRLMLQELLQGLGFDKVEITFG